MAEVAANNALTPVPEPALPAVQEDPQPPVNAIDTFVQSETVKHIGKLVGLAAAVAIGMVVVLWSTEPNYAPLYNNLAARDANEIITVLEAHGIDYKLDNNDGAILVAQDQIHQARLKLAAQGLPQGTTNGLEILQEDQSMGTSQFIETARYHHALEQDLSRSVESIRVVESARVHLALPKQSIFIRNRTEPSASVVVKLYSGKKLGDEQVAAIVHMVSSSVPLLQPAHVSVVDQFGRLLSQQEDDGLAETDKHFAFTRKLEDNYADRIVRLLQPIVGEGRVNAEVSALMDFSHSESTREAYDPERSVIRSEQIREEENRNLALAQGIPGALSNQPPGTGTTDPAALGGAEGDNNAVPANQSRHATRNYEVDRVISHTRNPVGSLQRISVAVVIDDKTSLDAEGNLQREPYTAEELGRFESLVKETIGFDVNRGDTLSIINTSFLNLGEAPGEAAPFYADLLNQPWFWDLIKQVLGAIGLLIVYLMFGRPLLRSLQPKEVVTEKREIINEGEPVLDEEGNPIEGAVGRVRNAEGELVAVDEDGNPIPNLLDDPDNPANQIRRSNATYEQKIEIARNLVLDDPARVANVLRDWIEADS